MWSVRPGADDREARTSSVTGKELRFERFIHKREATIVLTRVVQRKRPRRSVFLVLATGLVAAALFAAVVLAALVTDSGTYDLTVPNKNTSTGLVDIGNGAVEYIGSSAQNQASGTGLFDPFVRLQGGPTEQGFNTDAAVTFDAKSGTWTHAIKVNAIPVVDCDGSGSGTATCWELFVDINDSNTAKRISLNDVQIFFTNSNLLSGYTGGATPSFSSPTGNVTTEEYAFSGNILINDVNQGSGRGDLRYLVPTAGHTWDANTWFVLYSKWGTTTGTAGTNGTGGYSSDGGFEEWKVRKTPNVSITKTADAASVNAGSNIGFTVTVTNSGVADATGVTISDNLPGGTGPSPVHWTENSASCSISGSDGSQVLTCGPVTLAAGGGSLSVHLSASTTQDNCGVYNNTANFTSTDAGSGSASASTTVNCAAIKILKESTKTGNPLVANAGAVFAVDGPDAGTTADFSVTDDATAAAPDEDATVGEVCVGGLAPGAYTVNETTPPSGYGGASQTDVSVQAVQGTNCTTNLPTGTGVATFTNAPLSDIQVNFRDGGSAETSATISCDNSTGTSSTTAATGWDTTETVTGVSAPTTIHCTITIDP
jgi:uncharacterized repeat protein (TIGR01451 family)